ncbi:MAG: hypothetical protein KDD33_09930 [Bdellovibrionales bacterium]|nr:hypothetical protein [Bdellovibrionales bacterium]
MKSALLFLLLLLALPSHAERVPYKGNSSRFNYDKTNEAKEVSSFWEQRKVAVGVLAGGAYGVLGGTLALHFHPQWSVDMGYGGGTHFQSYGMRVKRLLLTSSPLNPYLAVGFSRWQRGNSRPFNSKDVSPGFVGDKFMSPADRENFRIDERLIHGALGLQYVFTDGALVGYGIALEALLLIDSEDFLTVPTASLGLNYFF